MKATILRVKKINNSGSEEDTLVDDYKWKTFYFNAKKSLKVKIGNLNSDGRLFSRKIWLDVWVD